MSIYKRILTIQLGYGSFKAGDILLPHGEKRWCVCATPQEPTKYTQTKLSDIDWGKVKVSTTRDIRKIYDHALMSVKELAYEQLLEMSFYSDYSMGFFDDDDDFYTYRQPKALALIKIDPLEEFEKTGNLPDKCNNILLLDKTILDKMSPVRKHGWVNRIKKHLDYLKSEGTDFTNMTEKGLVKSSHIPIFEKYYEIIKG